MSNSAAGIGFLLPTSPALRVAVVTARRTDVAACSTVALSIRFTTCSTVARHHTAQTTHGADTTAIAALLAQKLQRETNTKISLRGRVSELWPPRVLTSTVGAVRCGARRQTDYLLEPAGSPVCPTRTKVGRNRRRTKATRYKSYSFAERSDSATVDHSLTGGRLWAHGGSPVRRGLPLVFARWMVALNEQCAA